MPDLCRGSSLLGMQPEGEWGLPCFSFLLSSNLFPWPCIDFHRCLETQPIRTVYLWYRVEQVGLRTRAEAKEIQDCIAWWVLASKTWVETCDKLQKWSLKRWSLYSELESELVWGQYLASGRIVHVIQAEDQKLFAKWNLPFPTVHTTLRLLCGWAWVSLLDNAMPHGWEPWPSSWLQTREGGKISWAEISWAESKSLTYSFMS